MNAFFLPCLLIGFTTWWSLLPDQLIMTGEKLSHIKSKRNRKIGIQSGELLPLFESI
jgi:hypothetical protein